MNHSTADLLRKSTIGFTCARINERVDSAIGSIEKVVPEKQSELTFWVKPDEPPQVIGENAAIVWLKSFMKENTPLAERIVDYKMKRVAAISGTPSEEEAWQDMKYNYIVRVDYDITTASNEYLAPGDGIAGKGTFEGLSRELYIKDLGSNTFGIIGVGTGSEGTAHAHRDG